MAHWKGLETDIEHQSTLSHKIAVVDFKWSQKGEKNVELTFLYIELGVVKTEFIIVLNRPP